MATNIIETIISEFKPTILSQLSRLLGENDTTVMRGLAAAVPTVMAAFARMGSTADGASQLLRILQSPQTDLNATQNLGSIFSNSGSFENVIRGGTQIAKSLFGDKTSGITQALSTASGINAGVISKLLSLSTPLVLSSLGKEVKDQGLSVGSLQSVLASQKDYIQAALPTGISSALSALGPTISPSPIPTKVSTPPKTIRSGPALSPLSIFSLAALLLLGFYLYNRSEVERKMAQQSVEASRAMLNRAGHVVEDAALTFGKAISVNLPNGVSISVPEGSLEDYFAKFLATSEGTTPKVFHFDRLVFDTGRATLQVESKDQLRNVATILKQYPNAKIEIGGHTDNTGDTVANDALSLARADSVREELVRNGIEPERISSHGYGDRNPLSDNSSEEGRAINRRIDLTVISR